MYNDIIFWSIVIISILLIDRRIKDYFQILRLRDAKQYNYDEQKILNHLNELILQNISQYVIFNISNKPNSYINTETQQKMIDHLINIIPNRLSSTLRDQLSLICAESNIGEYLAENIYMTVQNFTLEYNMNNSKKLHKRNIKEKNSCW